MLEMVSRRAEQANNYAYQKMVRDVQTTTTGWSTPEEYYEKYNFRDFSRPQKDLISGMLPPKLAKILINLSQTAKNKALLDPFCGSGTILQEAALLEYEKVIGTDISDKAIQDSLVNLEWVDKYFKLKKIPQIFVWDAQKISEKFTDESINGIATEPLLGPPLKGTEDKTQLNQIIKDLEPLYINFFNICTNSPKN